jgi:hypothetical protein
MRAPKNPANAIILNMFMHCSPGKIALIWVKFLVNATNTVRVALHRTQCGAACGSFFCRVRSNSQHLNACCGTIRNYENWN